MTVRLIGLGGKKAAGKDTVADRLVERHGFIKVGFSDLLLRALLVIDPIIPNYPGDGEFARLSQVVAEQGFTKAKEHPEVRQLFQRFGTDFGRTMLGEDVWVNPMRDLIADMLAEEGTKVVTTGVRYPNELSMIDSFGGLTLYVVRPQAEGEQTDVSAHVSETSLTRDDFFAAIENDGTLELLHEKVDHFIEVHG